MQAERRLGTWRALEEALTAGKVRAIGVSNFLPIHLAHLLERCSVKPHVNQFEMHPLLPNLELRRMCAEHGIKVVAYASLGVGQLLTHAVVRAEAARCGRTASQLLLRWAIQHGAAVLPKASTAARIEENAAVFDFSLSETAMAALDGIAVASGGQTRYCWDPTTVTH
jgi:diketogulonate reductase-like aldo/keto reductase